MRYPIAVIILFYSFLVSATEYPQSDVLYERVWLATDRDVYISGDEVHVSVATIDGYFQLPIQFSAVAYIELFASDGSAIIQEKALLQEGRGEVLMTIPKDLKTDYYYIRAYTNYQKNFGAASFLVKKIRLINPFKVIPIDNVAQGSDSLKPLTSRYQFRNDSLFVTFRPDSTNKHFRLETAFGGDELQARSVLLNDSTFAVSLKGQKNIFSFLSLRSTDSQSISDSAKGLSIKVQSSDSLVQYAVKNMPDTTVISCVSVFRADHGVFNDTYIKSVEKVIIPDKYTFLPELTGDIIFGSVSLKTGSVLPHQILATRPGNVSYMQVAKVYPDGRFSLAMKGLENNSQLLLTPTDSSSSINITIQNEFYSSFASIPVELYQPERRLGEYVQSLMVNVQIADAFSVHSDREAAEDAVFYGRWDESVAFSQFISLPSMEEYIHELMPSVYVSKKKKRKSIRISDYDNRGFIGNNPLLLVDGTPFFNHGTVLYIPPKEVKTVNILNRKLTYMSAQFDGVFDIRTRDNFAEALEIASNVIALDYTSAKFKTTENEDKLLFKNAKYWNSHADQSPSGQFKFDSAKGNYMLRIQGLADGKPFDLYSEPLK